MPPLSTSTWIETMKNFYNGRFFKGWIFSFLGFLLAIAAGISFSYEKKLFASILCCFGIMSVLFAIVKALKIENQEIH
jgi:hypothetical protein